MRNTLGQALSIIIVNYNGEEFLENCVQSFHGFLSTSNIEHEILIIDNASTDRSASIIKTLSESLKEIKPTFSKVNLGFGKANNILIEQSIYPTLILLNNDTLAVDLHELCRMAEDALLDKNTVYTSIVLNRNLSRQKNTFSYPKIFNVLADIFLMKKALLKLHSLLLTKRLVVPEGYYSGCYLILNKALFYRAGEFDDTFFFYHEECDLFLRMERIGITKCILNDKIIHYGSGDGAISDFSFKNYYINLARLLMKHRYGSVGMIKFLFNVGFKFRILLLNIGFRVAYSPFSHLYQENMSISTPRKHIIGLHRDTLSSINNLYQDSSP